jgi:outer membrane protein OmpA-like peptidoglycan-associated protein
MKNFLGVLLCVSTLLFSQQNDNTFNVGGSFGVLSEMGVIGQDGFSPVFDLNVSKQITSQVALSTNFMLGSANLINSSEQELGSVNFSTWSANLLYHIIQLEKTAFYLKGGVGLLGYTGKDSDGNELYTQSMFSAEGVVIPTGVGIKYRISDKVQAVFDFSTMFPMGPGLDNTPRDATNDRWDIGFKTITLGATYTFGNTNSNHAEWANPVDIVSTKVKAVEEEVSTLSIDTDGDGVSDKFDKENDTPDGVAVDGAGRALDVDSDGVADYKDIDPFTAPGVAVDVNGQELDDDMDGVPNSKDEEPNSPVGCTVNFQGRQIVGKGAFLPTVYFDTSSSEVTYSNYQRLATVASVLKANPGYKLRVIGFADSVGATEANYKLGLKRANAVIECLINTFGVDINRMVADSQGENNLLANENQKITFKVTQDGLTQTKGFKSLNRRVEFIIE